jgi:hypothetical protein
MDDYPYDFYLNILSHSDDKELLAFRQVAKKFISMVDQVSDGNFFLSALKKGAEGVYADLFCDSGSAFGMYATYKAGRLDLNSLISNLRFIGSPEARWFAKRLPKNYWESLDPELICCASVHNEHFSEREIQFMNDNKIFFVGLQFSEVEVIEKYWPIDATLQRNLILGYGLGVFDLHLYYSIFRAFKTDRFCFFEEVPEEWVNERNEFHLASALVRSNRFDLVKWEHDSLLQSCSSPESIEWYSKSSSSFEATEILNIACSLEIDLATLMRVHQNVSASLKQNPIYTVYPFSQSRTKETELISFTRESISYLISNRNWKCLDYAIQHYLQQLFNSFGEMLLLSKLYEDKRHPLSCIPEMITAKEFVDIVLTRYVDRIDFPTLIEEMESMSVSWDCVKPILIVDLARNGMTLPDRWLKPATSY